MQVSYNAIIREMDAEELQEELERVKADNKDYTFLSYAKIIDYLCINYKQITGQSLKFKQTK